MGLLDYNTEKPERTLSNVVSINPNQRFIDEGKLALEEQMSASENPYARMFEKTVPTSQEALIEMGKRRIKERGPGLLKSAGLAIARGVPALGQLTGHALKTLDPEGGIDVVDRFGQKIIDVSEKMAETDIMRPRKPVDEGFVGRGIRGGLESTIPSFAPMVAGAGAGAAIGSVVPGVGTVIGGIIGGATATLGIHGLGVYGQEKERYLQQGIDEKTAHKAATQQGLVEGGIETVSNIIGMLTFGWGKLASQPLKQTAKELLKTPVKTFAKNLTKNALLNEVPTEMIQGALGAKIDERIGLLPEGAWQEAAVESIIPALTMSVIFGLGAQGATSLQRNNIKKQLNSENPKERVRAAEYIAGNIDDNELRQAWIDTVTPLINEGLPININADFTQTTSNEIDQVKADIKSGLMAEGIKSGDLTSEMIAPVIEKVATQDPALAKQLTDMFAVKETDLTENERRFEEDPLDAENNAEYLDKYIKRAALPEGVALTTEEKIAERAKILEEAPRRPAEIAAEVFEKELPAKERKPEMPAPTEPTAEVAREPVGVEKLAIKKEPEVMVEKGLPEYEKEVEGEKVGKAEVFREGEATELYDKYEVPEGSFVHGRYGREDLDTGNAIFATKDWSVAEQYAGSEGSMWLIKPTKTSKILDADKDFNKIRDILFADYEKGILDYNLDEIIKSEINEYGLEEAKNRIASGITPENIVESGEMWDVADFIEWISDKFEYDIAVWSKDKAAVVLNPEGVAAQMVGAKPLPPKPPKAKPPEAVTKKIEGEVIPEPTLKVEKIELKELQAIKTKKEGAKIVRSDTYETQEEFLTRIIKEKDLEVDNTHDIRPEDLTLQEYADSVNKNELETWVDGLGMEDSPPKFSSPADLKITYEHPEATREEIEKIKRGRVKPKIEKEKVEVTPEKKEPWEITRDEYVKQYIEEQRAADFPEYMITDKYKESVMRDHFAVVSEAFAGDKTIPPEVLKDYPDLKIEKKVEVGTTPEGKKPKYRKVVIRPSKVRTLRGAIRELGGIDFQQFKGELETMDLSIKYLHKKTGRSIDLVEMQLKEDGWLYPDEVLLDVLTDKKNLSRDRIGKTVLEKPEHELSPEERRIKKEMKWEPEEPPKGEYTTINAEDLPLGKELTLIEGESKEGWDIYEVTAKDPFEVTLVNGQEITLHPLDKIDVLKEDLAKPAKELEKPIGVEVPRKEYEVNKEAYGSQEKADAAIESVAKTISDKRVPDRGRVAESEIVKELRTKKRIDFTGRKLTAGNESQEIAEMFQVYRSPKLEILHTIYTDKAGVILGHNAMTSGQIDYVAPKDFVKYISQMKSAAKRLRASKTHILHNHPSGNANMSPQDVNLARHILKELGDQMGGFIVIDHGKFSDLPITGGAISGYVGKGKFLPRTGIKDWTSGKVKLLNEKGTAIFGRSLAYDKNKTVIIYLNTNNEVQGWTIHDKKILAKGSEALKNTIQQQIKAYDSRSAIIIGSNNLLLKRVVFSKNIGDWLLDVQDAEGNSFRADYPEKFQRMTEKTKFARGLFEERAEYGKRPTKDYRAMLRRYQEAHTTPLVDELVKKTQADFDPVSATPEETKAFFKDVRLMPKRFRSEVLSIRDMKWYHKAFETPYVLAKKFVSMKAAVKTEINRHESRTKKMFGYYHGDLADLQKHMQKNPEDLKAFESLVWEWEGHRFSEKEVPTDWYSVIEDVKDDDYGGIRINPEHYTEVRKYLKKQGVKDVVADGFVAVRKTLDNVLIEADATMRGNNIDPGDLKEFRSYIGKAHNYFSHIREGNSYIKITNLNTKKTVYREHFWTLKERALPERKMAKARTEKWLNDQLSSKALSGKRSDYLVSPAQKVTKLPDEIFFQIPVEALSQISIEAGKGLSASRVHYEALRLMKKEGLSEKEAHEKAGDILTADMGRILAKAMSDVLKTRGWGKHAIQRQNIPGFKKTDVFETLSGYLTGYAGFATKIQAAKEHSKTLRDIDARKTPNAYKYTSEYVRDMLANADKTDQMVDRLRGLFFVKYLGGVVKSGVVNLTQNAVMAGPILSQYTKFSHIKLARAMKDTRRGITGKNAWMGKETDYKNLSKAEQKALTEMVETGAAQDLYLRELKGDIPGKGWGKYVRKVIDKSGIFMMIAEKFNRASTGLAAYRIAMNEGVLHEGNQTKDNHDLSVQFAKGVIYDSHFLYGKPNLPAGFRGGDFRKIARAAYTFRSFTHNYLDIMVDLMANQGTQGFKVAGRSLMNLMVVGGLTSIPFFKALSEVIKWASDDEDEDLLTEIRGTMSNKFMQDVLVYGLVGASGGFDLSGSLSIEVPRSFKDLIGVPYAVKEDYMNMVKSVKAGNIYRAVSETPFTPIVMRNAMRGIELYTKGQRTRGGKAINVPGKREPRKITGAEAIKKGILGLQPTEVSSGYKAYRAATKMKRAIADRKRDWADRIANATIARDFKKVKEIKAEIREWNTLAKREGKRWRIVDITEMVKGRLTGKGLRGFPVKMRKEVQKRYSVWQ